MKTIRLAAPADAAAVAGIYAPYCEESAVSFEEVAPSTEEMTRRIAVTGAVRPWLVLEVDGVVVGYAYASAHHERAAYRWAVSTAIYVRPSHHRRGVGRALYTTLFEVLRHLGYYQASAGIALPNRASVALHEAVGFKPVGVYRCIGYKLGRWYDVAWYQTALQTAADRPTEPRSIAALHGTAEWHDAVARGLSHYVDRP
jgi:phosphinothricin acetyltransferase